MKNAKIQLVGIALLVVLVIVTIFNPWFGKEMITAGDFWPFANGMYMGRSLPLSAWDPFANNGFGSFSGPFLWILLNFAVPITFFGNILGMPWENIQRLAYLYPFLIICFVSPVLLFRKISPHTKGSMFAGVIYLLNTYILMIVGGGQIAGVGMGYALAPLVIILWMRVVECSRFDVARVLTLALTLSVQIMYDLRLAYITIFLLGVYFLFKANKKNVKLYIAELLTITFVVLLLNAYWIIPSLVVQQNPFSTLGDEYSSIDAVRFFSFAKLENSIALLHPNWPENVFGKTSFMKPEFLIIPLLAFASLLFLPKEKDTRKNVLFMLTVALIGVFLAKGTQDPGGNIYVFLFEKVPGFVLFRDPTKWILCIAIAYSILIPYSVSAIVQSFKNKLK